MQTVPHEVLLFTKLTLFLCDWILVAAKWKMKPWVTKRKMSMQPKYKHLTLRNCTVFQYF